MFCLPQIKGFEGLVAIRKDFGSWVAGLWFRGQTVVCCQGLFKVLRVRPTPLAGNVFEVGLMLLTLLLSYHRRLRMVSEELELRVQGGRISHRWCMCVVVAMVGLVGAGREVVDGMHEGLVAWRGMPEHFPSAM